MERSDVVPAQIERIQRKLTLLRERDTHLTLFGADQHRYALVPCLDEPRLNALEAELGIRFPEGYRRFLLQVSDGGAGPGYGLYSLDRAIHLTSPKRIAQLFPLILVTPELSPDTAQGEGTAGRKQGEAGTTSEDSTSLATGSCRPDERAGSIRHIEALGTPYDDRASTFARVSSALDEIPVGTLPLAGYGCGILATLVISGPERGAVWIDDLNHSWGLAYYPIGANGCKGRDGWECMAAIPETRRSFLEWYEDWLDESMLWLDTPEDERRDEEASQSNPGEDDGCEDYPF